MLRFFLTFAHSDDRACPSADEMERTYWNNRSTAWFAWLASDSAVVESCWRVCNASMLAPSVLTSARVRESEPVCKVLIIWLVKFWRLCTIERFEPNEEAWLLTVMSALCNKFRSVSSC